MTHPLLNRLYDEFDVIKLDQHNMDLLDGGEDTWVLFFPGPMQQYPESLDVAVILPEILKHTPPTLKAACVEIDDESPLRTKFGFDYYPALVFIKHGIKLDSICKVQDWSEYMARINTILTKADNLIPMQTQYEEVSHV